VIKILIIIVLFSISISNEKTRTFILKNGDKITGELIDEDYNSYVVKTNFGELKINKSDIKADKIFIKLKNGDNITGTVIDESEQDFKIKTNFGELKILKNDIDIVDFINQTNQKNDNSNRFYYPDDQLIDIWFDPIGFTLEENSLYFSGLSWAYGITDKFQVSSKWTGYFRGDLNFRPKYMFFKSGDVNKTQAASIGFHYHMRGSPNKRAFVKDDSACEDCPEGEWKYITDMIPNDEPDGSWGEIFIAFTQSNLRETGKGRINYNAGFSITYYKEYDPMQRFYLAIDIDANKKLKLMAEVAYDEYYAPWYNLMNDEDTKPIHFDFGFMYTPPYNENLRIGIHYQAPWLAFYYKF
tara:strand:- start:1507 stop:2571 length:1065 start_codon:yes stop_codon:yes gene_type:complete